MKKIIYTINAYPLPHHLRCGSGLSLENIDVIKADVKKFKEQGSLGILPKSPMFRYAISNTVGPWEKLPLEHFHHYAKKVGADFHQINEESIPSLCLPPSLIGYQACNMLKFSMFHHFVNSDYDQMLYLDLDILIKKSAKNIFECIKDKGIYMSESGDEKQIHAYKYWLKNNLKIDSDVPLYNGGAVYADKKSIIDFYQKIPQLGEWGKYYKKYGLHENYTSDNDTLFNEQNWMSFFFHKQNIKINKLLPNWNLAAEHLSNNSDLGLHTHGSDFVHYYAEAGKRELIELYEKRQANSV